MQIIVGQPAHPIVGVVRAGVTQNVGTGRHALAKLVGEGSQRFSGTPNALRPVQVKASVTQRLELSIVAWTSAADCTRSSSSVSQARPPVGSSNDKNS